MGNEEGIYLKRISKKYDKLLPFIESMEDFKLIPNSKIEVIDEAGHIPSIEKADEFNRLVISFLR